MSQSTPPAEKERNEQHRDEIFSDGVFDRHGSPRGRVRQAIRWLKALSSLSELILGYR